MSNEAFPLRQDGDGIASLTLNRPAARNALSVPLMTALEAALADTKADPAVRVAVIAGAGPAFCAGHDRFQELGHGRDRQARVPRAGRDAAG